MQSLSPTRLFISVSIEKTFAKQYFLVLVEEIKASLQISVYLKRNFYNH